MFRDGFEHNAFSFSHALSGHPLFALERLVELAKALRNDPAQIVCDVGDVRVDQRWDDVPLCALPAHALIEKIQTANAWILLKHVNRHPGYRELLAQCVDDVAALAGRDLDASFKACKAIVFLNSPNRVTSYHIDHQSTFLLQIAGTKTISIFDRADRAVLPEGELERFWARDDNAAIYKPQYQDRATVIHMTPGVGVHIPVNAPHWVQNGPDVSVSLNFNFDLHDRLLGDIYRSNYWLRKVGLQPAPPHRSPLRDGIKATLYGCARSMRELTWRRK